MAKQAKAKINTARFPGESDKDYRKRMARNKRVRERRKKQRAAKKAAKAKKPAKKPAAKKPAAVAPVPQIPVHELAIVTSRDSVAIYKNGAHVISFTDLDLDTQLFADGLQSIAEALGAICTITKV